MGSFGYVGNFNTHKDKGLVSATLGLVYVRQSNFQQPDLPEGYQSEQFNS